jgi:hypothetical protein
MELSYVRALEVMEMPEVRAPITVDIHRKLKQEAVREGKHLKDLIAEILEKHVKDGQGGGYRRK